ENVFSLTAALPSPKGWDARVFFIEKELSLRIPKKVSTSSCPNGDEMSCRLSKMRNSRKVCIFDQTTKAVICVFLTTAGELE
ncbi:hypothetical protein P5F75_13935, partial [Caldifermentibacillus hisashii]|uniref:hypothetical protein n=1 Tax=Caldifermentibacillus hisashii TaxID=996558 RepID=UPI002E22D2C7|nr:hypothetical protein [Caldifermentibacillus hisashii]